MARHPRVSLLATIVALSGGFFTRSLVGGAMLTAPRGTLHGSKVISRRIHLCKAEQGPSSFSNEAVSVTGIIYQPCLETHGPGQYPIVTLFTKHGCTLCDKVKDMLYSMRDQHPHTLEVCFIRSTPFSKSCYLCLIYGATLYRPSTLLTLIKRIGLINTSMIFQFYISIANIGPNIGWLWQMRWFKRFNRFVMELLLVHRESRMPWPWNIK